MYTSNILQYYMSIIQTVQLYKAEEKYWLRKILCVSKEYLSARL